MPRKDEQEPAQQSQVQSPREADKSTAGIEEQAQAQVDADAELGYRGVEVDLTPNEAYTVAGVSAGTPVPETQQDPAAARLAATNPDLRP